MLSILSSHFVSDVPKQNVSEPKNTTQKQNQQGTAETESPVIVNDVTIIVPGTQIKGEWYKTIYKYIYIYIW